MLFFFIIFMLEALPSPIIFLAASLRLALYHTFGQVQRSRQAEPVKNLRPHNAINKLISLGARARAADTSPKAALSLWKWSVDCQRLAARSCWRPNALQSNKWNLWLPGGEFLHGANVKRVQQCEVRAEYRSLEEYLARPQPNDGSLPFARSNPLAAHTHTHNARPNSASEPPGANYLWCSQRTRPDPRDSRTPQ